MYNSSREKEEQAAYVYDIPALMQQVTEGQPPRKMQAVIPKGVVARSGEEKNKTATRDHHNQHSRLMEHLHNGTWKHNKLEAVQTRPPKYHEGQYRLNFSGRVLTPSVKNMQLENEQGDCLLQFGKVDDNTFHLDYKVSANATVEDVIFVSNTLSLASQAPFTAFSAFG